MSPASEVFSASGILKVLEIVLGFITVIIHRYGDYGKMIFFGNPAIQLSSNSPGLDAENLGNGVLVSYLVISSVLLASYVIDGRFAIQEFFLEWIWNFLGAFLYAGAGVIAAITWTQAKNADLSTGEKAKNYDAALTMAALCIILSILYFLDFLLAKRSRARIQREGY